MKKDIIEDLRKRRERDDAEEEKEHRTATDRRAQLKRMAVLRTKIEDRMQEFASPTQLNQLAQALEKLGKMIFEFEKSEHAQQSATPRAIDFSEWSLKDIETFEALILKYDAAAFTDHDD